MGESSELPSRPGEDGAAALSRKWRHYLQRPAGGEEPRLELDEVTSVLRRRWGILVGGTLAVTALAVVVGLLLPERYTSNATFLVEGVESRSAEAGEALAVLDRLGRGRSTETEIELLQGRRVIEPVVDSLDLHVRFEPSGERRSARETFPLFEAAPEAEPGVYRLRAAGGRLEARREGGGTVAEGRAGDTLAFAGIELVVPDPPGSGTGVLEVVPFSRAVESTRRRIEANPARLRANLVRLTCDGPSAEAARRLCSRISSSYLRLRSDLQHAEASAAADFLDDQVRDVQARLRTAEESLQAYEERTGSVALEQSAGEAVRQHANLRAQREQLEAERDALASLIGEIEGDDADLRSYRRLASFPTFVRSRDNVVSRLVESLVELEDRRSELAARRTSQNPELAAMDARIEEIESQLLSVARSYEQSLAAQVRSLEETLSSQSRQMATIPERQVQSARLERRVSMLEELYRFLQTRLQEAEVARAVELPSVRVVDRASLPYEPSFPNLTLLLAVGAVLGLGAGMVGVLWREHADDSVRDREELEEAGIPVLGMVPRVEPDRAMPPVSSGPGRRRVLAPAAEDAGGGEEDVAAEAFRDLVLELVSTRRRWGGGLRSVAVTSSGRGEGKTFCACNLAVQAALLGERVLLIDADLRGRGVARWLGLRGEEAVGLREVLSGAVRPERCVQRVPVGEGAAVDVLASGRNGSGPARVDPDGFRFLVNGAPPGYDLIVVDTPPLSVPGGAAQITPGVDAAIMVVRAGTTDREGLEQGLRRVERASGQVLGVVLNDLRASEHYLSRYGSGYEGG